MLHGITLTFIFFFFGVWRIQLAGKRCRRLDVWSSFGPYHALVIQIMLGGPRYGSVLGPACMGVLVHVYGISDGAALLCSLKDRERKTLVQTKPTVVGP